MLLPTILNIQSFKELQFKLQTHGLCVTEKLKLDRDFSKYNYLGLDSAVVNGLDDAANFRTVRVSATHTHTFI